MTAEQFGLMADELRANPPKMTGKLVGRRDGDWCHCSTGQLLRGAGHDLITILACDMDEVLYEITVFPLLFDKYGIDAEIGNEIVATNDSGPLVQSPEDRAERVITAVRQILIRRGVLRPVVIP